MFGRIHRVRLRTSPIDLPSLCHACARTLSSKSRTEAILSAPPTASCILWKSCNASWPGDEEQNNSANRATKTEKRGRDGDAMLGMDTTRQYSVPRKMSKHLLHFQSLPMFIQSAMRGRDHQQSQMFSYLSPETRVRKDHPLRAIRVMVDGILAQLSRRFDSMYASAGRASILPEKLLRAQLLQTLYSIRSEPLRMEEIDYSAGL